MDDMIVHINGRAFSKKGLRIFCVTKLNGPIPDWEKEIWQAISDWLENDQISFHTSGSTGEPKAILHSKESIAASSKMTADYFNLNQDSHLLHCLPARYVAGKMMIYRTLCLGCHLTYVEPKKYPEIPEQVDLASMVPMQVEALLHENAEAFSQIKQVLIGGAPMRKDLKEKLLALPTPFFESYGMTETLTHIALKKLEDLYFKTLPSILVEMPEDTLNILAPHISQDWIKTNDLVKMHGENEFELMGRKDDVINSGGIKIHPRQVEEKLEPLIESAFYIAKKADAELGEKVCLFIEGTKRDLPDFTGVLKKHEMPKELVFVMEFKRTFSGKIIKSN
ncbi:MAG: AMP-binding protein [Bacteroidota bacterium]